MKEKQCLKLWKRQFSVSEKIADTRNLTEELPKQLPDPGGFINKCFDISRNPGLPWFHSGGSDRRGV